MVQWSKKRGAYTLRFRGDTTDQPILSMVSRASGVDFNIRASGVQKVGDVEIGTMFVDINGSDEERDSAIAQLRAIGVVVEEGVL